MTKLLALVFAGALLVICAMPLMAQRNPLPQPPSLLKSKDSAAPAQPVTVPLGVGTAFNATLDEALDTRKVKAGDQVTVEVAEDVFYERSVIFPKGTKISGHVVRATSGGRGRTGSALFLQLDKAVLSTGEQVILNAGIQALAAPGGPVNGTPADSDLKDSVGPGGRSMLPVGENSSGAASANDVTIVTTTYDKGPLIRTPLLASPRADGEITPDGLFTPESRGALGRPDLKVYTPTSEGSRGTVLLSSKKNMHLDAGTRLLLVVQPLAARDAVDVDQLPDLDLNQ